MTQTITDNLGSVLNTRNNFPNFMERNLNLTEAERQIRLANGLNSDKQSQMTNSQIGEPNALI